MLLTKLFLPQSGNNLIQRQHLYEKLNAGLFRKLTLVSAQAGFGKTTLVSEWIRETNIQAVWFSADEEDSDPVEFLNYIIYGIRKFKEDFGTNALQLLVSPEKTTLDAVLKLLINEILLIKENFLLVIDDFHRIRSNEINNLITTFLDHLPANLHLVILTRSDPTFPYGKIRSQHQLVELRSADLSFTGTEINSLVNRKLRLDVSPEDISVLQTKSEGWIAGLQLITLSLQNRRYVSDFIRNLKGDNRYIMDYLVEEVLRIQTEETKNFLIQTSILDQMSAPLCNEILNLKDSQSILENLERHNMFLIPLDSERKWYRYHHLFADLLRQRFNQKSQGEIAELHNKASDWFEKNDFKLQAIEHAVKGGNFNKSQAMLAELIEELWNKGNRTAILKYCNQLSQTGIKDNPEISLYYGWALLMSGQIKHAEDLLENAANAVNQFTQNIDLSKTEISRYHKLSGKIAVVTALLNSFTGNADKIFYNCTIAEQHLSEEDPLWFSWLWHIKGIAAMVKDNVAGSIKYLETARRSALKSGNIYLISTITIRLAYNLARIGHFKSSFNVCDDFLNYMHERGMSDVLKSDWSFAVLYSNMAAIQFFCGDMDEAYENIKIAQELCTPEADRTNKALVLITYSMVLLGRGDLPGIFGKIHEFEELLKDGDIVPNIKSIYIGWKGSLLISQQHLSQAKMFFHEHGLGTDKKITYSDEHGYFAYAMMLMAEGKLEEAEILLSNLLSLANSQGRMVVELKIIYALFHKLQGEKEKARAALFEAIHNAAENNILMYFVFYSDHIKDLLQEIFVLHATSKIDIPNRFIERIKAAIEKREKHKNINAGELTDRELDMLRLIAVDLSNQEIAEKMFISLNTVKTHLKNLYVKLDAGSRKKAIQKGKELRLL